MSNQVIDAKVCISAPVAKVWEALTNLDITEKYWGDIRKESDWQKGSTINYKQDGVIMDKHEPLEIVLHRFIEHTVKPMFDEFKDEPPSLVNSVPNEESGKTCIVPLHRQFPESSKVYAACCDGWPQILAS